MRRRTNMSGLVSHTTPDGKSRTSSENRCRQGIKRLEKMLDEGWEITGLKRKSSETEFKLFGTITMEIPVEILIKAGFRK